MNIDKEIIMPDILGVDLYQASVFISKIGLKLGDVIYEESEYNNYTVIDQSIKHGEKIKSGQKLDLKVSGINPIRYLPSIFQIYDQKNNNFLKRFLWIFQDILNSINIKLDNFHRYMNPLESPGEFFNWLASWFSINLDYAIPENKIRLLVKEAVKLYQSRGTATGISKYLEIITNVRPEIIDGALPGSEYVFLDDRLVDRPILEEDNSPYNFTVSFPVPPDFFDIETIKKIHQVLKSEKPVHSNYHIIFSPKEKKSDKKKTYSIIGRDIIA